MSKRIKVSDDKIIEVSKTAQSGSEAASILGIKYETYKVHAKRLNCFRINQCGKGLKKLKKDGSGKIPLHEIFEGKHPQYQANKLRKRLFSEKLKDEKCEICGIEQWLGKRIALELDHIDGNRYNHNIDNLRILCPNCHSQTDTYRGKNKTN
jgi:5-methylcytosine-specific restriction endonuclease McrA